MERNQKTPVLLLLLFLQACRVKCHKCPSSPDPNLTCFNDFNHTMTCEWNSASDRSGTVCTLFAEDNYPDSYSGSCELEPVDSSRPALMACSVDFKTGYIFYRKDNVSLKVSCGREKHIVSISYKPYCHIKVNPGKPAVNATTVSWSMHHSSIKSWKYELQWKRGDQAWSEATVLKKENLMSGRFKVELEEEWLDRGQSYEARVRMMVEEGSGPWSDWSPAASWVSPVGRSKQPPKAAGSVWQMSVAVAAAAAVLLLIGAVIMLKRSTWVYVVKRIRGPPILTPPMSLLQDDTLQGWLQPYFTSDSFHSVLKPVEVVSVEVASAVDAVVPWKPQTKASTEKGGFDSTGSNFSNPSYSDLCGGPPPVFPLFAGSLEACAADSPYGPVGSGAADRSGEEPRAEEEKDVDILKLFCKENSGAESAPDGEKLQVEHLRLQSLDSGVCSGEEVSQESMEADSIGGHDEEADGGSAIKVDFRTLLGSSSVFSKGSILVCSGYEAVEKLSCGPVLPRRDSNPPSSREEPEEKSPESTPLLLPPCSVLSQHALLMAAGSSVEPSGDGYTPVSSSDP
ncbi:uncharacterized protein LOC115390659 isoform X2 [Salarias fasciatus]|uniref:uncharacterized protein LOC115390659 isoform X2 n=1 Tax=Salarias fasciatus TaxID=181472 RepID=UPI001176CDC4|nr:uncharacterized protein LOC115390659 isoform X2 [Salarias fasciatus]